jgi:hypothetical protein
MKRKTIEFKLHGETELPQNLIDSIPSSGAADNAVAEARQYFNIEVPENDLRRFLKRYGAWDAEELSDHDANIDRLIWLACLDCRENETTYFYMGE